MVAKTRGDPQTAQLRGFEGSIRSIGTARNADYSGDETATAVPKRGKRRNDERSEIVRERR
jgi:hypothetical protein